MSAGPRSFFTPRLAHHKPEYNLVPATPGSPIADWRSCPKTAPTRATRLRNHLLPKRRQIRPSSPLGLSKLPYELLAQIFNDLTGREIAAVRLVCTEWELATRAFFHERKTYPPFPTTPQPPGHHTVITLSRNNDGWTRDGTPPERCFFVRHARPLSLREAAVLERPDYRDRYRGRRLRAHLDLVLFGREELWVRINGG